MSVKKELPKDPDLAGVDKALKRAAKSARTLARQTKTPCYVVKDGKIVDIARRRKTPKQSG
ncbi:MAG: hypothetical protein FD174_47 [Geobacteraceae bacterium]|nr:MAG: hypothetical protein FD174_47 [Geobacteraceae bacterium]